MSSNLALTITKTFLRIGLLDVSMGNGTSNNFRSINTDDIQRKLKGNTIADYSGESRPRSETVDMYGHSLTVNDDGVSCTVCDESIDVPEIFQESSGFNQVVYKLYIFGQFKNMSCEHEYEQDNSILHTDDTNIPYNNNRILWCGGDTYTTNGSTAKYEIPRGLKITHDGSTYEYQGNGSFLDTANGAEHMVDDLIHRHGKEFENELRKHTHKTRDSVDTNYTVSATDTDLTNAEEKTLKQKMAEQLQEKRNHLTR